MKVSRWVRLLVTGVVLAAALGGVAYRLRWKPVGVEGHVVGRGVVGVEVMGTGTLEARVKTAVSARIQERLVEVLVDQGDRVAKGGIIARLDDGPMQRQVEVAEATLAAARQTAERVRADLARAKTVLAQAELNSKRLLGLVQSQAVAQSEVDKAAEALGIAVADLRRSEAAIAEADGQVVVADKNLSFQREQLAFTTVTAPYDGLVIRRDRDPGEVLVPGASIVQLVSLEEIWVSAWVDEAALPRLADAQVARIVFRAEPGKAYPGRVARLGRETDRETREFVVDVRLDQLPGNWTVGQRAEVFIETARHEGVLVVPAGYVVYRGGKPGVYVDDGGRAQWHGIEVAGEGAGEVAVIRGIGEGVLVIRPLVEGKPLREGQAVKRS